MHRDPDVSVGGLSLWVTGRAYPDAEEPRGQDLLGFQTLIETANSTTHADGMLSAAGLLRFGRDLTALYEKLSGEAVLQTREGETTLTLTFGTRPLGHVEATAILRLGPGGDEQHSFSWDLDQSYLPLLVSQVRTLSVAYPPPSPSRSAEPPAATARQNSGPGSWFIDAIFGKR